MSGTIKYYFFIRKEVNRWGYSQVYLSVTCNGSRKKIKVDIEGKLEEWVPKKQRFKDNSEENSNRNLILDSILSNVINIVTSYKIQNRMLTLSKFIEEYYTSVPRFEFLAFFEHMLKFSVKENVGTGTYRRHKSVLEKLKQWKGEILFHELDLDLIKSFTLYLSKTKKNGATTVNSNLSVIKKYITLAEKNKIPIAISHKDIRVGSTNGSKTNLEAKEVKQIRNFYFSEYINETQRLIAGYFLFSCFTGLRLGDIQSLKRKDVLKESFHFIANKTLRWKSLEKEIKITPKLQEVIKHDPQLFVTRFTGEYMNRELKQIAKFLGITKRLSMHVGRHTFATNYLRAGGTVEKLQVLLGHSKINETMGYVHVVHNEAQEEVLKLDNLF